MPSTPLSLPGTHPRRRRPRSPRTRPPPRKDRSRGAGPHDRGLATPPFSGKSRTCGRHRACPVQPRRRTGMDFEMAAESVVGRRKRNEDAWVIAPELGLCAVADGMGGYEGGNVASALTVRTVESFIAANSR